MGVTNRTGLCSSLHISNMKCILLLLVALCVTFSVQGRSVQLEERLETRNAVIDKILEELKKAEHVAKELLKEAAEKIQKAKQEALIDWEILKAKIQEAAAKGEALSKVVIAEAKAKILKKYQEIKPIIENIKAKAKEEIETIVQKIKDSDALAAIKVFAERVKSVINNFIDHIPDYEELIKEKLEDLKSVVLEKAKHVQELLIKARDEAEQKLKGLIITAKHILETEIEPKVKAELEKAIAIAKEKLQEASIAAKQAAAKVEEKIDEIAALINDKTGGAAEALIKKAEAQLKELVAKAADKVDDVKAKVQKLMEEIEAKINELLGKEATYMDISSDALIEKIMEELEGPISKLPSLFQGIVKQAIKTALKYGIAKGKDELIHLLNKVGDKFGSDVKDITDMAIMMLEMMDKRELHERNAVIDKIVEELKKVKHAAEELLHEALEKIEAAKQDALIDWEILKAKIQEAAEKGEAMSKEMITEAKAKILKKYQEIKPIIDNLKAQAKAKVEEIVQKIKDSVPIAAIKQFAERVKATINSFIDHIPDYEEMIKEKIEEIKSIILQQAEKVRDLLIKVENEAEQKLKGLILVAKKILEEEVKPKVKAELELLIDLAEQKFAEASSAAGEVTAKLDEKISEIAALINDKTGGAAKPLIEKAEAELKDLIAKGEVKIDEL